MSRKGDVTHIEAKVMRTLDRIDLHPPGVARSVCGRIRWSGPSPATCGVAWKHDAELVATHTHRWTLGIGPARRRLRGRKDRQTEYAACCNEEAAMVEAHARGAESRRAASHRLSAADPANPRVVSTDSRDGDPLE